MSKFILVEHVTPEGEFSTIVNLDHVVKLEPSKINETAEGWQDGPAIFHLVDGTVLHSTYHQWKGCCERFDAYNGKMVELKYGHYVHSDDVRSVKGFFRDNKSLTLVELKSGQLIELPIDSGEFMHRMEAAR